MSAFTVGNSTSHPAEFHAEDGVTDHGVVISAGATAKVDTSTDFEVVATTTVDGRQVPSARVSVEPSALVVAQATAKNLFLSIAPGLQPSVITVRNAWQEPVQFDVSRKASRGAAQIVVVGSGHEADVDAHVTWRCYAMVDGMRTGSLTADDPNAVFTVTRDERSGRYVLTMTGESGGPIIVG